MTDSASNVSETTVNPKDWIRSGLGSEAMLDPRELSEKNSLQPKLADAPAPEFRERRKERREGIARLRGISRPESGESRSSASPLRF